MKKVMTAVQPGDLVLFTLGWYSDYSVVAVGKAKKPISHDTVRGVLDEGSNSSYTAVHELEKQGYFESLDFREVNLGYGYDDGPEFFQTQSKDYLDHVFEDD